MNQPTPHPPAGRYQVPRQSKAIPIINPDSLPSALQSSSSISSNAASTLSDAINDGKPPASNYATESSHDDGIVRGFDVYARAFVPQALSVINVLPALTIDTPPLDQIDFDSYVRTHAGSDFVPPIPESTGIVGDSSLRLSDVNMHTHYEAYFRFHLAAEIQAQELQNESYSLYEHDAILSWKEQGQPPRCAFTVPGLRENSPYVEDNDIVYLRQFQYDGLPPTPSPVPQSSLHANDFQGQTPRWTGLHHNSRVLAVQRKEERVIVRASGIISQVQRIKLNIQFPVPKERYLSMQQVLPVIQHALSFVDGEAERGWPTVSNSGSSWVTARAERESRKSHSNLTFRRNWLQSMLFPAVEDCRAQNELNPGSFTRSFYDEQLNWEQKKTVESVCLQNYGNLPYLISGPPGTGKTKTLVEIALQLINRVDEASHILLCAPSDPAADTLVQRLSPHCNPGEMLRLNRSTRTFAEVSGTVMPFCFVSGDAFDIPPFRQFMRYKIVVTTTRDAAMLMYARMTNSDLHASEYGLRHAIHPFDSPPSKVALHWTALLMDEAAQAIEPEALVALSVVASPLHETTNLVFEPLLVMAGDEYQLGPRLSLQSSPLKFSLFARLFARPVYAGHPLARGKFGKAPPSLNRTMLPILRPAFANLIRNYRSHPAILAVPSSLFYADTLEPEAADTERLASWPGWRGRRWPVLFCNNESEDDLEMDGGGWYNNGEAEIACSYASHLVSSGLVKQEEVCIMSPFKASVQRLRETIRGSRYGSLWNVDIGPTEIFQGLERGVVILCTTRSKIRFLKKDQDLHWGIIGMPNKMNVALTRAKFGLIVIGKRNILQQDPNWVEFLGFCDRNGLLGSEKIPDSITLPEREGTRGGPITRLEKVLLADEESTTRSNGPRKLKVWSQEDEMWTRGMQATMDVVSESESSDDMSANEEV